MAIGRETPSVPPPEADIRKITILACNVLQKTTRNVSTGLLLQSSGMPTICKHSDPTYLEAPKYPMPYARVVENMCFTVSLVYTKN